MQIAEISEKSISGEYLKYNTKNKNEIINIHLQRAQLQSNVDDKDICCKFLLQRATLKLFVANYSTIWAPDKGKDVICRMLLA